MDVTNWLIDPKCSECIRHTFFWHINTSTLDLVLNGKLFYTITDKCEYKKLLIVEIILEIA